MSLVWSLRQPPVNSAKLKPRLSIKTNSQVYCLNKSRRKRQMLNCQFFLVVFVVVVVAALLAFLSLFSVCPFALYFPSTPLPSPPYSACLCCVFGILEQPVAISLYLQQILSCIYNRQQPMPLRCKCNKMLPGIGGAKGGVFMHKLCTAFRPFGQGFRFYYFWAYILFYFDAYLLLFCFLSFQLCVCVLLFGYVCIFVFVQCNIYDINSSQSVLSCPLSTSPPPLAQAQKSFYDVN